MEFCVGTGTSIQAPLILVIRKAGETMKRRIWILAMAPVMWVLWRLVLSADRLHAWQYSENFDPPTAADFTRAAITFWCALLTPIAVGTAAAIVAFRRQYTPQWPYLEMGIIAYPYLTFMAGLIADLLMLASMFVGGAVVVTLLNLGACLRQRMWGKSAVSALVIGGGVLYLLWLYVFIIYIDT